jgi:hypothetical protein
MRMLYVESLENFDVTGMESEHYLSRRPYERVVFAQRYPNHSVLPFAISLQSQITYMNVLFLSRIPCHLLKIKIVESF